MNRALVYWAVMVALAGASVGSAVYAQESPKALPTLVINVDEVVSLDTNDPAAPLLKVKDRYGFETPIYLTPETKITQGDQALTIEDLAKLVSAASSGTAVKGQVEYNFDINTAKRYAVRVEVSPPSTGPAASEAAVPIQAPVAAPAAASSSEPAAASSTAASVAPEQLGQEQSGVTTQ